MRKLPPLNTTIPTKKAFKRITEVSKFHLKLAIRKILGVYMALDFWKVKLYRHSMPQLSKD